MPSLSMFLDRVGSLLDRRFFVGWWFPVFFAAVAISLVTITSFGLENILNLLQRLSSAAQAYLFVMVLLAVTLIAFLLKALTYNVILIYEGYYWPPKLKKMLVRRIKARHERLTEQASSDVESAAILCEEYPAHGRELLPTILGNVMRSSETYAHSVYGLDIVGFWARLWPLIPKDFREQLDDTLTSIAMSLNLCTLTVVVIATGGTYMSYMSFHGTVTWYTPVAVLLVGLVLARSMYISAVAQASVYGQQVRVAADLYRFDLLEALRVPVPATVEEEFKLWEDLSQWMYFLGPAPDGFEYQGKINVPRRTERQEPT